MQDSGGSHKVAEAGHSRGKWWRRAGGIPTPSIGPVLRRVGPAAPPVSTLRRSTHHAELQPRSPDPGAHWGSPVHHSPATSAWFRSTVLSLAGRGCSHCATAPPGAQEHRRFPSRVAVRGAVHGGTGPIRQPRRAPAVRRAGEAERSAPQPQGGGAIPRPGGKRAVEFRRRGGVYVLDMWVAPFQRKG